MQIIKPRWYQEPLINDTYAAWNSGNQNVALVAPCGSGKTYTMGFIAREFQQRKKYVVVLAHRDVLLSQISLSMATLGIRHNLMCSKPASKFIRDLHVKELGDCFYDENASVLIASVGTFNKRNTTSWQNSVGLWLLDETHHLLAANQWGQSVAKMENAYGLGVTATFCRLDGKGLGRNSDGVFDVVVSGVETHDLIQSGELSRYRVVSTPLSQNIHSQMKHVRTNGGEYNKAERKKVLNDNRKQITGDVVGTYKKFAMGLRGITFCQDIETCESQAQSFINQGVSAIALSHKTPAKELWKAIDDFKSGKYLQLVNCQLFGEGFDVPACYCASLVSPTKSYGKYVQELMRSMRPYPGKEYAWIFDHVGNVAEHGLPDYGLDWESFLFRAPKKPKSDNDTLSAIKLTTCINPDCLSDYELPASNCPWCGTAFAVVGRAALKNVDGDLVEMTDEELKILRNKKRTVMLSPDKFRSGITKGYHDITAVNAVVRNHTARREEQITLRDKMTAWAETARAKGIYPEQAQAQFTQLFGCDIHTAQTLGKKDAAKLAEKIDL